MINDGKFWNIITAFVLVLVFSGCALFRSGSERKPTKIIPVNFGQIDRINQFKPGLRKPYVYIIWGNDVRNGAQCEIRITNTTQAETIYRKYFVHDQANTGPGLNYELSKIIELDSTWNRKIGEYQMDLYVDGKRISSAHFSILP